MSAETSQNLPPKQSMVTAVNAIVEGHTYTSAAELADVSRTQLYQWRKRDATFQQLLNEAIAETQQASRDRLNSLHDRAVTSINQILTDLDSPPAVRLQAAKYVLDRADQLAEDEGEWTEEQARDLLGDDVVDLVYERAKRSA